MYIPPGFGTVAPYIFARDAERLVRFFIQGLCGQETCRTMRGDMIANCQVAIGTTTLMVSEASDRFPPSQARSICLSKMPIRQCSAPLMLGQAS